MCDTCRPALGPLCMSHRGGGARGKRGGRGEGNSGGKGFYFVYEEKKGEEEGTNAGLMGREMRKRFPLCFKD